MKIESLMEELFAGPYRIIDILPERVTAGSEGQYAAVEQYFLQPDRLWKLRKAQAEMILKLSCYYRISVSFDAGESWEDNPEPAGFVERFISLANGKASRVLLPEQETIIELDGCDTYMTVYNPSGELCCLLEQLSRSAGLFLWE